MDLNTLEAALTKALSTAAGVGGDFIPEDMADEFISYVRELNFCRQLFRTFRMASKTRDIPKILSAMAVYYESTENVNARSVNFTTGTITLTAKKFLAQVLVSEELYEDSKYPIDPILVDDFANAVAEAEELTFLQGDIDHTATITDPDNATSANWYEKDPRLAFDGLLTLAKGTGAATTVNAGGGAMTETLVASLIYRLGKYGRNFKNDVLFLNPWSAIQLMQRESVRTVDKYGPGATIITGEVGRIWGQARIIESAWIDEGEGCMTHAGNPIIGDRRAIKIKSEEWIQSDSRRTVVSERLDFTVQYADALVRLRNLAQANLTS